MRRPRPAMWAVRGVALATLCGCEVTLYEHREVREPDCERAGVPRECLCPDDTWGEAACYGPGESGPCDCVGATPGGGVIDLAVGGSHACAVLRDERIACWGENGDGQLGDGTRTGRPSPVEVVGVRDAVSLALGGGVRSGHSCALGGDGLARCWGLDEYGQLGDGEVSSRTVPRVIALEDLRTMAAGTWHTCAIDRDGRLWCWGRAEAFGRDPAAGGATRAPVPERVRGIEDVVQVAPGERHTCALTGSGDVLCWGAGPNGRLGTESEARRVEPARVADLPPITHLSAGWAHTCALDRDGSAWCWGANDEGQLGTGRTSAGEGRPIRVQDLPDVVGLDSGRAHTCAATRAGAVYCWGANARGQLGDGTADPRRRPVAALDSTREVVQVAAGGDFTCARTRDSRVYCFGDNRSGQLGDGTDQTRDTATAVRWQLGEVDFDLDAGVE